MTELPFGTQFQNSMLCLMLHDLAFAERCIKFIPQGSLSSESHEWLFAKIKDRFDKDGTALSYIEAEEFLREEKNASKSKVYKSLVNRVYKSTPVSAEFIRERLTDFARRSSFTQLFLKAQGTYNSGNYEKAYSETFEGLEKIYEVDFKGDLTINIEIFEKFRRQQLEASKLGVTNIPTKIPRLDNILKGGLSKGELGILLAEPKKGKSIGLVHMGAAAVQMSSGRVAHFVLEGTTIQTVLRYQSRLSGITYNEIEKDDLDEIQREKLDKISHKYKDRLEIIPMNAHWEYTTADIEAGIKDLERKGKKPDLVIVDYGDLLHPRKKTKELRHDQTSVYRDLKRIALINSVSLWTASQAVRPKESPDNVYLLRAKDISESFEKVRIADFIATINQTPKEKRLGKIRLHADMYRSNDCDETINMYCDYTRMIFSSPRWPDINYKVLKEVPGGK